MAKNEYVKKIKLDIDLDAFKKSKEKIDEELEDLTIFKAIKGNKKMEETLRKQIELKSKKEEIDRALRDLEDLGLQNSLEALQLKKESNKIEKVMENHKLKTLKSTFAQASSKLAALFAGFVASLSAAIASAIKELNAMTSYDQEDVFYSEDAYNQQLQYGLSDAENYALSKVKDKWNFSDEEYMMGGYNDERAKLLKEQLELYRQQYNEMKSSGYLENIAEMRKQLKEYQEQFQQTLGKFFVEHGDTIMIVLNGMLDALGGILSVVASIFSWFDDGSQSSYEADRNINNIIDKGKLTNNNINISNQMNATSSGVTNVSQLKSVTADNYRQLMKAMEV